MSFPKKPKRALRAEERWVALQGRMSDALAQYVSASGWDVDETALREIDSLCIGLTHRQVDIPFDEMLKMESELPK